MKRVRVLQTRVFTCSLSFLSAIPDSPNNESKKDGTNHSTKWDEVLIYVFEVHPFEFKLEVIVFFQQLVARLVRHLCFVLRSLSLALGFPYLILHAFEVIIFNVNLPQRTNFAWWHILEDLPVFLLFCLTVKHYFRV